jgi:hypothetical protein
MVRVGGVKSYKVYTVALIALSVDLLLGFGAGMAGCGAKAPVPPAPVPQTDHSLTITWNQSFANNPACSATVTTSCITGFVEGYLDAAGKAVQLHTDTVAVCSGPTDPLSCTSTFNATFAMGQVTFYVATTYVDLNGSANTTSPGQSTPVLVGADPPANIKATVNS